MIAGTAEEVHNEVHSGEESSGSSNDYTERRSLAITIPDYSLVETNDEKFYVSSTRSSILFYFFLVKDKILFFSNKRLIGFRFSIDRFSTFTSQVKKTKGIRRCFSQRRELFDGIFDDQQ